MNAKCGQTDSGCVDITCTPGDRTCERVRGTFHSPLPIPGEIQLGGSMPADCGYSTGEPTRRAWKAQCLVLGRDGRAEYIGLSPRSFRWRDIPFLAAHVFAWIGEKVEPIIDITNRIGEWVEEQIIEVFEEIERFVSRGSPHIELPEGQTWDDIIEDLRTSSHRLVAALAESRAADDKLWAEAVGDLELKLGSREPFPAPLIGEA